MKTKRMLKGLTEFQNEYKVPNDGGSPFPTWVTPFLWAGVVGYCYHVISRIVELYF